MIESLVAILQMIAALLYGIMQAAIAILYWVANLVFNSGKILSLLVDVVVATVQVIQQVVGFVSSIFGPVITFFLAVAIAVVIYWYDYVFDGGTLKKALNVTFNLV